MKLIHLEYFTAVCRLGSATQAANLLSVSQPAISAAIRELETEFGVLLFTRVGKHLEITEAGQQLYEQAVALLEKAENTRQIMFDITRKRNRLSLGITPMLANLILPQLYGAYRTMYPDVTLQVQEGGRHELFQKLDGKELDMVICSRNKELDGGYQKLYLMDLEFGLCVHPDHPLAQRDLVTIRDLKDEPMAGFSLEYQHNQALDNMFAQEGLTPRIIFRTSQISTILEMTRHKLVCCCLYTALQSKYPDLRFIPLDAGAGAERFISINLYWRKQDFLYHDMEKMIRCIRSLHLK